MEDVSGFSGVVPGFLESVPGFLGVFRVLGGLPDFLGVPGCSGVPVFLEVLHAVSFSCQSKQLSRCCINVPHEPTCQILTNQRIKLDVERDQRVSMV